VKLQFWLYDLPWNFFDEKPDNPKMKRLRERLHEVFGDYRPRRMSDKPKHKDYQKHEIDVTADDPTVEKLIREFNREVKAAGAAGRFSTIPTPAELGRARWVPLVLFSSYVDDDANDRPLNQFGRVVCSKCSFPDLASVPDPYLVSRNVLKNAEIFPTSDGVIVVRERVLDLLRSATGGQVDVGEARLTTGGKATSAPARGGEKFWWVRPKHAMGDQSDADVRKKCAACGRATERRGKSFQQKPRLDDMRSRLSSFGDAEAELAVLDFFGQIFPDGSRQCYWPMAISGSLFAHLKANGVKGISTAPGGDPPTCYFSEKGEPTLEPTARTYALPRRKAAAKAAGAAKERDDRVEAGRKVVEGLADVPWDHTKDGYVYLYLTTPKIVMLDPMTWEEDNGGPYEFKGKGFKPGLYRVPVSAVRGVDETGEGESRGVAVDSASLLMIDNAFYADLAENFDWEKSTGSSGRLKVKYLNEVARRIGNRFGFCSAPGVGSGHDFQGDGLYTLDVKQVERVG
jgi:hypothetical protein